MFWFIPVGVSIILGCLLFILALIRITALFVTVRKIRRLVVLYFRLSIFILMYLILIVFITAYNITTATNQGFISDGYENYYLCLLYGYTDCSLDDSVTNYNLVMLKSFAISSLGLLLFFLFLSWDVIYFWYDLAFSVYYLIIRRTREDAMEVVHKLASAQITTKDSSGTALTTLGDIPASQRPLDPESARSTNKESGADESSSSSD